MSTYWSMYVVPDQWKLRDCTAVSYMFHTEVMMSKEEFEIFHEFKRLNWDRLYTELLTQPSIHDYTSDDGGDPDYKEIMGRLSTTGRLYRFPDRVYELIPRLKKFVEEHEGKRYICSN